MREERQTNRTTAAALIALSFLPVLLVAFLHPDARQGHTDFLSFYAGARLVGTEDLYSFERAGEIQAPYCVPGQIRAYIRPPFYAVLLYPLGRLPYGIAHVIWQLLNIIALAGFVALWQGDRLFATVLCCWFVPILANYSGGQDAPILLLCIGTAYRLLKSGRPILAGAVLAVCGAKFHLFLLTPLWLVAGRKWRVAAGLVCGGAALTAVSFAAAGPNWIGEYLSAARHNDRILEYSAKMPNFVGLFHGAPHAALWIAAGSVAVTICTWVVARREVGAYGMAVALAAGLLIGMHGFLYDCSLLLTLLLALAERFGSTFALRISAALSLLTITLTIPAISYIGQLSVVGLFGYAAYGALAKEGETQ